MVYDYSTFHGRVLALEEATAEWRPRARKTAKNLIVDDHYLRGDNMEGHDVLMPLWEGIYTYVETNGTEPIPMHLENALYELGRQPRWKIAQDLFGESKQAYYGYYEKIWRHYTVLTDRFAHQVDFHLGAPQLMAIWKFLGIEVSHNAVYSLLTMAPSSTFEYLPLYKLATENFIQLVQECERAVLEGKERTEPTRMDKELTLALKKSSNSLMETLDSNVPGLSAGVLYSMGYTSPGFPLELTDQRDVLNQKPLSKGLHEYAVRLMEMSLQVKNLSTQLHLLEMCGDSAVDVSKWADELNELGAGKPIQHDWKIVLNPK